MPAPEVQALLREIIAGTTRPALARSLCFLQFLHFFTKFYARTKFCALTEILCSHRDKEYRRALEQLFEAWVCSRTRRSRAERQPLARHGRWRWLGGVR